MRNCRKRFWQYSTKRSKEQKKIFNVEIIEWSKKEGFPTDPRTSSFREKKKASLCHRLERLATTAICRYWFIARNKRSRGLSMAQKARPDTTCGPFDTRQMKTSPRTGPLSSIRSLSSTLDAIVVPFLAVNAPVKRLFFWFCHVQRERIRFRLKHSLATVYVIRKARQGCNVKEVRSFSFSCLSSLCTPCVVRA